MLRRASKILIALLLAPNVTCQSQYFEYNENERFTAFQENFDDNSRLWNTENLWISSGVNYGFYTIKCNNYQNSTGLSCKSLPVNQNQDYEIETKIKISKGTGGLVLGMNDRYDHIRIEIDDNSKIAVIKDIPSKQKIEKLFKGSIKKIPGADDFITITYRKTGNINYVFINEILIEQFQNIILEGDQIGFNVGIDSEIIVDYLRINYLKINDSPLYAEMIQLKTGRSGSDGSEKGGSPKINWISPGNEITSLDNFTALIKARIHSESDLKSVLVYLNGESKGECLVQSIPGFNGSYQVSKSLNFGPEENSVYIVATNTNGATKSEMRYFRNPTAIPPEINWEKPLILNTIVDKGDFIIETCIGSATELKSVKIIVNGDTQYEGGIFDAPDQSGDCNYSWHAPVILKPGDNDIFVIATNAAGSTTSEKRTIRKEDKLTEKRLALVFGNSEYGTKIQLKNPVNDANLMEATLKQLGFDVIKRLDADKNEMTKAVRLFCKNLPEYNVALFYYAGHGIQVDGINYLLPTDAILKEKEDCKFEALRVDFIVEEFEKYQDNTNVVILDACRSNPFAAWDRGGDSGFKAIDFTSGTIISFATSEGQTAADGSGNNGLFTEELTKQMMIPQPIESVFKKTRIAVKEKSNGKQVPQEWSKLNGEFFFVK